MKQIGVKTFKNFHILKLKGEKVWQKDILVVRIIDQVQQNSKVVCFGERVLRAETVVNYIIL